MASDKEKHNFVEDDIIARNDIEMREKLGKLAREHPEFIFFAFPKEMTIEEVYRRTMK